MGMSKLMLEWCEEQEKLKKEKMLPSLTDLGEGRISKYMNKNASEIPNTNHSLTNKKDKKMSNKKNTEVVATTDATVTNMKPKPGTAKPSGAGVGKGGPKTSPTDGRSLKPSGAKGGKMKKGSAINK